MKVLILAAGYGTRLYPLTRNRPKALVAVNHTPMINYLVKSIGRCKRDFNIRDIVIISNSKFFNDFFLWQKKNKFNIEILNDGSNSPRNRLGAVGDINFAIKSRRKSDWLVLGSDNLFDWNLSDFLKFSLRRRPNPVVGLYDIGLKSHASRYGVVKLGRQSIVKEFKEKPTRPRNTLIATCIYYFPKESLVFLDKFLKVQKADAAGRFIAWLLSETKVYGYVFKGNWLDIGHKDALKKAEQMWR